MTPLAMRYVNDICLFAEKYGIISQGITGTKRINELGLAYFGMIQSTFLIGFGANRIFFRAKKDETHSSVMHGPFYLLSGIYGSLVSLHQLNFIHLREAYPYLTFFTDATFILANIAAIKHCVELYLNSPPNAYQTKFTCVMGALSAFAYLMLSLTPKLGISNTYALVFGCIAVITGGVKIVYDFFVPRH